MRGNINKVDVLRSNNGHLLLLICTSALQRGGLLNEVSLLTFCKVWYVFVFLFGSWCCHLVSQFRWRILSFIKGISDGSNEAFSVFLHHPALLWVNLDYWLSWRQQLPSCTLWLEWILFTVRMNLLQHGSPNSSLWGCIPILLWEVGKRRVSWLSIHSSSQGLEGVFGLSGVEDFEDREKHRQKKQRWVETDRKAGRQSEEL